MKCRDGIAVVLAIVVLVVVELMSAGMLALATQARLSADSRMRTARADAAALGSIRATVARWPTSGFDTIAVGRTVHARSGAGTEGDASWSATVERLGPASWLIRSRSRVGDGTAYSLGRRTALARILDVETALTDQPTDSIALGGLRWRQVESIADRQLGGAATLADTTTKDLLTYAASDLQLGGVIRGVVVVKGNLTLVADADFQGLAVAAGDVVLESGSRVAGSLRSGTGAVRGDAGGVQASDSLVEAVLRALPARLRVVSEDRRFLPAF